jgi:hypothetical protein
VAALIPGRAGPALLVVTALLAFPLAGLGCGSGAGPTVGKIEIVELPGGAGGTAGWSPDSRWIAVPDRHGIRLLHPDRAGGRQIVAPRVSGYLGPPARLTWSDDGRRLRYLTDRGPTNGIAAWATEIGIGGSGLRQTDLGVAVFAASWEAHGWPLVYAIGPYGPVVNGVAEGPGPALMALTGSGHGAHLLLRPARRPDHLSLAADGGRLLYTQWQRGGTDLWAAASTGSHPHRLARFFFVPQAEWSPGGRRIALAGVRRHDPGGARLFVLPADGGKPHLVSDEQVVDGPTWSPDGRWLTYSTPDGKIRRIHPDGSGAGTIADLDGEEVRGLLWSPNGRYLAYTANPFPSLSAD